MNMIFQILTLFTDINNYAFDEENNGDDNNVSISKKIKKIEMKEFDYYNFDYINKNYIES